MTVRHANGSIERRPPSRAEAMRWRLAVSAGAACALAGITVAAWPRVTLALAATLLGVQLTAHGGYRVAGALGARGAPAVTRLLVGVIGMTSGLVGVVCLADVAGTVTALGTLIATFWIGCAVRQLMPRAGRRGRADAAATAGSDPAEAAPPTARRAVDDVPMTLTTVVSVLSGFVVLTLPNTWTTALTMVLGLWLVALGTLGVIDGLSRRDRRLAAGR